MLPAALLLTVLLRALASGPCVPSDAHREAIPSAGYAAAAPQDTLPAAGKSGTRHSRAVLDSGAPVMELGTAALERSGARELHEALRTLPGLSVRDYGGIGGLKTVSLRGLGATHTAACEDGILLRDARSGSIDLAQTDLDEVGGITVELGVPSDIFRPASVFFSGGVLDISSRRPDFGGRNIRASASFMAGSLGTFRPALRVDRKLLPGWSITASGSYLGSRGDYPYKTLVNSDGGLQEGTLRREGSDVSTAKATLRLDGETRSGGTLWACLDCLDSDRGLPGAAILYTQNPTERLHDRNLSARAGYERIFRRPWRLRVSASYRLSGTRYTDSSAVYPIPVDDRYMLHSSFVGGIIRCDVSDAMQLVLSQDLDFSHLDANTAACPLPSRLGFATALSARYSGSRLTATAALAALWQHEWLGSPNSFHPDAAPDRMRLSPSASLSYTVTDGLRLRFFIKDGYRVPTFNDLYYDRVGSISLVPEKAFQTGAGVTWRGRVGRPELFLTGDLYHNSVRDKIVAVPTMFVWRMRNLGRVSMNGADLSASLVLPLGGAWTLRGDGSWSFLSAIDISDPSAANYRHQIQYTPRHSGSLGLSLGDGNFSAGYTLCMAGRRWYLPENIASNALPAYFDHMLSLRRTFRLGGASLTLAGEALNLGGLNYEIVRSYPMPGRQIRLSIKIII